MKKIAIILFFLFSFQTVSAEELFPVNAYFFNGEGCPHCAKEHSFLESIQGEFPTLQIHSFEIYYHKENAKMLQKVAEKLNATAGSVPFLVIGDEYFVGFSEEITPGKVTARIEECQKNGCHDSIAEIVGIKTAEKKNILPIAQKNKESVAPSLLLKTEIATTSSDVTLPVFGTVDPLNFSLPLLTIVLGVLDGFNPCAMWTLLFLISLLLGMQDKKRMWILGGTFIATSSFVYFLFMSAWLNIILFVGIVAWLKILVAMIALVGGGYSLKEFFTNAAGTCNVGDEEKKEKVFGSLKQAVEQHNFWIALSGIILLAFVVNLIELVCSAGLPVIFTQILALNHLSFWQYYSFIGAYIFFFMIDDLFVFVVSMKTLQMAGITTKYAHVSKLIGGTTMILIGLLLLFKPEWLMFG